MPQPEPFEVLVLGSGVGGKLVVWHLGQSGYRTAVVERRRIGGSCLNIACSGLLQGPLFADSTKQTPNKQITNNN
jgi:glycine/D-amino acid oxidase-like deaminating enzyme